MKKLQLIYLVPALLAFTFLACEKDYEDLYTVTNYADFEMAGDPVVFNPFGTPYTDAGATATEAGEPLTVTTTVSGDFFGASVFDPNATDRYVYTYQATNSDGYEATVIREVYNVNTGNLIDNLEGLYTSTVVRDALTGPQYTDMEYVIIGKSGDQYLLSDALGGWYELGRALGPGYRAPRATFTANNIAANDFTFGPGVTVGGFGGTATLESMTVNPATKTIVFTCFWTLDYTFTVTLTQVEP